MTIYIHIVHSLLQVNSSFIMNITNKVGDNQQQMTIAGLDFETMQDNFSNSRLHIICHANVFHLYQKKADVFLKEERPRLASVLGTRESSYTGRYIYNIYIYVFMAYFLSDMYINIRKF